MKAARPPEEGNWDSLPGCKYRLIVQIIDCRNLALDSKPCRGDFE